MAKLSCRSAVIDVDAVALDEHGVSNFSKMQEASGSGRTDAVVYYAFDLLHLNGKDLRALPLTERKEHLAALHVWREAVAGVGNCPHACKG